MIVIDKAEITEKIKKLQRYDMELDLYLDEMICEVGDGEYVRLEDVLELLK